MVSLSNHEGETCFAYGVDVTGYYSVRKLHYLTVLGLLNACRTIGMTGLAVGLARIQWRGFHSVTAVMASNDTGELYPNAECRRRGL